jgi:thiamine-phosphate pyrophosphorylase
MKLDELAGLYAIVDPAACRGRDPVLVARAVLRGGCAAIQLRDKIGSDRSVLALARSIGQAAREAAVPFFVDDRLDVALACDADGVHLGQDDLPIAVARTQAGVRARPLLVGVSTHDEAQCQRAQDEGANLVGFGPVFPTTSKERPDPVIGLAALGRAVRAARRPVVAIGGIDLPRIPALREQGVKVAALLSAVCGADDPEQAARALHDALLGVTP